MDETVVVKADLLNVRKEDRADARIYVQLKNGEKLRRIGYNEEWSQVEYDGKTAYVASDLVEVWVEETDARKQNPRRQKTVLRNPRRGRRAHPEAPGKIPAGGGRSRSGSGRCIRPGG